MARPEIKGLKYFPLDVGFFRDRKIRLLRGDHGAEGIEVYLRLITKAFEDNGYYLLWDEDEDYTLLAEETGYPESKLRGIMTTLFRRLLLCILPVPGNGVIASAKGTTLHGRSMADEQILPMSGNVITSRSIQRRYFNIIKETKVKAAAQGRYTFIEESLCMLTEEDFSELNKTQVWLKVAQNIHKSENNSNKSGNNHDESPNNPVNEMKVNEMKEKESNSKSACDLADDLSAFDLKMGDVQRVYAECELGKFTTHIDKQLAELATEYSPDWLIRAMRVAGDKPDNKRHMGIVKGILRRWKAAGRPDDDFAKGGPHDTGGKNSANSGDDYGTHL